MLAAATHVNCRFFAQFASTHVIGVGDRRGEKNRPIGQNAVGLEHGLRDRDAVAPGENQRRLMRGAGGRGARGSVGWSQDIPRIGVRPSKVVLPSRQG